MKNFDELKFLLSLEHDKIRLSEEANSNRGTQYRTTAIFLLKDEKCLSRLIDTAKYYDVLFSALLGLGLMHVEKSLLFPAVFYRTRARIRLNKNHRGTICRVIDGQYVQLNAYPDSPHRILFSKVDVDELKRVITSLLSVLIGMCSMTIYQLVLLNYLVNSKIQACEMDMKGNERQYAVLQEISDKIEPLLAISVSKPLGSIN
jgi:hypothetical protein